MTVQVRAGAGRQVVVPADGAAGEGGGRSRGASPDLLSFVSLKHECNFRRHQYRAAL